MAGFFVLDETRRGGYYQNMNLEQPNLTKNKEKKPENLEEANGIIESLKGRVSYLEKWGKRGALLFLTVSGLLINSGIEKNKEGKEKKLIEEEFKKLKTSIEKATFHFERHELGKGILVKDKED